MGLMDAFKANENKQLKSRIEELEAMLTPEMHNALAISEMIKQLEAQKSVKLDEAAALDKSLEKKRLELEKVDAVIAEKRAKSLSMDEEIMFESFGIYTPRFNFAKAENYKTRLDEVRKNQKSLISSDKALNGNVNWTVNGSTSQGKKMVKDMQKLLLRAFNSECDELVDKVKYNNFDASLKRINASCDAISKLGSMMQISISNAYRQAKIDELTLAFEYAQKKQAEKEAEKEERARLREEAKLMREIEEERKRLEKEQTHYQNALQKLNQQLEQNPNDSELLAKRDELNAHLSDVQKAFEDVDYREANKRAGYVYVISNIGAFGENVYKIGMTRRLDPQERVDELGDASVPFAFDVHAMIFSDDAPKLEAALHRAFEDKKLNMVNPRREFFNVSLDDIKAEILKNYDKTVEFTDIPDAEQWRISARLRGEAIPTLPQAAVPNNITSFTESSAISIKDQTIEVIKSVRPNAVCDCTEKDGVISVSVSENGVFLARIRVSNHKRIKVDIIKPNSEIQFFDEIVKIKAALMLST